MDDELVESIRVPSLNPNAAEVRKQEADLEKRQMRFPHKIVCFRWSGGSNDQASKRCPVMW